MPNLSLSLTTHFFDGLVNNLIHFVLSHALINDLLPNWSE